MNIIVTTHWNTHLTAIFRAGIRWQNFQAALRQVELDKSRIFMIYDRLHCILPISKENSCDEKFHCMITVHTLSE